MNDRGQTILATADALYGAITMPVVAALFPDVSPARLRHLIHALVVHGALVPCWAAGSGQRVWLTTRSASGRGAGLRKWLADGVAIRSALMTKNAGTIRPPVTFLHAQMAGLVVAGLGTCGRAYDSELHTGDATTMADGIAYPEPDWRLVIEVERMVRQGPGRWQKQGGLVDKVTAELGQSDDAGALTQHLIVCPKLGNEDGGEPVNFERELDTAIAQKAAGLTGLPRDAGWWFLPIDDDESDPVWHPIFAGTEAPRPLPGIAARRAAFAGQHAKNAERDRARKLRAAATKAGVSLPAGVTMLPTTGTTPATH